MESETTIIRKYLVVSKILPRSSVAESWLYEMLKATDKLSYVLTVELYKLTLITLDSLRVVFSRGGGGGGGGQLLNNLFK